MLDLDRRDGWLLTALLVLLVLSRVVWVEESLISTTYWEDEYRWVIAHELIEGPLHSLLEYQADHYQGGSLVMILTIAGLFQLLGPSPLTLKLAAILFSGMTLTLLYLVGRRGFGRPTALCAAGVYLLGPPLVAYSGLLVMGSHGESIVFSLLQVLLLFRLLSTEGRTGRTWFAFGLVSGLGLWFCYTSGLSLAACGLTWLALERLPRWREVGSAVLGGFIGLIPWFAYNVERQFVGLGRILEVFGMTRAPDPWIPQSVTEKATLLFFRDWPTGLLYPFAEARPEHLLTVALIAFAVPLAVALFASLARVLSFARTRLGAHLDDDAIFARREVVFLVYGLIWLAFFLSSRFTIDPHNGAHEYRLFLPPAVLLLIPAARSAALGLRSRGLVRGLTLVGLACVLVLSTVGSVAVASRPPGQGALAGQFGHRVRGLLLHRKYESDLTQAFRILENLEQPRQRREAFRGLGWGVAYRFEESGDMITVREAFSIIPQKDRRSFLQGVRWAANTRKRSEENRLEAGTARPDSELLVSRFDLLIELVAGPWPGNNPRQWQRKRSQRRRAEAALAR